MPNLWSNVRFGKTAPNEPKEGDHRTDAEKDYDRILFSGAVRRLADKTQVFPLDKNDSVRKRLTHSHEVANLAKSIGLRVWLEDPNAFGNDVDFFRTVAPTLGAAGLAHDLGNPPFGHQGEAAIKNWFAANEEWIFTQNKKGGTTLPTAHQVHDNLRDEFLEFDGNPQSLRLIARLQTGQGNKGLDLTACALAACMKYVVPSGKTSKLPGQSKIGYFCSEEEIVKFIHDQTGLSDEARHPVAWITEAADDTAYSVLDLEDSIKKGILSPDDILNSLLTDNSTKGEDVVAELKTKFENVDAKHDVPSVRREAKSGYLRSLLIDHMARFAAKTYASEKSKILSLKGDEELLAANPINKKLKDIALKFAYLSTPVLQQELIGRNAINRTIESLWSAISDRKDKNDIHSKRTDAKSRYVWSLISDNYIEAAKTTNCGAGRCAGLRYRELRLLTDMISGMTDKFAIELDQTINSV